MSLISPIIVQMKILLLDICKADYHWDAELELKTRWMKLISELGQVNAIQIPRCVTSEPDTKKLVYELEAFSDGHLLGNQIPNQYSSSIDCTKKHVSPP